MPRKPITLSHLEQELERLLSEHEKGLHMGKNEAKVFRRIKQIREQITAGNFAEEPLSKDVQDSKLGEVVPAIQYYEQELERLRRELEKGLHMGKNEAKVSQRMKELKDQILLVEEKDTDWPEEAVWTSCVTSVSTSSFDWDDGATVKHGVCSRCEGTGFRLQIRKRINVNDA